MGERYRAWRKRRADRKIPVIRFNQLFHVELHGNRYPVLLTQFSVDRGRGHSGHFESAAVVMLNNYVFTGGQR